MCFEFSENRVDAVLISSGFADPDKRPEFDADPMNAVAPFPNQQLQQMRLLRGIRRREVRLQVRYGTRRGLRSDVVHVGLIRPENGHANASVYFYSGNQKNVKKILHLFRALE